MGVGVGQSTEAPTEAEGLIFAGHLSRLLDSLLGCYGDNHVHKESIKVVDLRSSTMGVLKQSTIPKEVLCTLEEIADISPSKGGDVTLHTGVNLFGPGLGALRA